MIIQLVIIKATGFNNTYFNDQNRHTNIFRSNILIEVRRNKDGLIYSYIEFNLVNRKGYKDPDGRYIFIDDLYIHNDFLNNGSIRHYIKIITDKFPQVEYGYFVRDKYNKRVRIYTRNKWRKVIKED